MSETQTTPACMPPRTTATDTWHWLRHQLSGSLIVSNWIASDLRWHTGHGWWDSSPMGPLGASAEDMHKWGWRWVAEAIPPESAT